MGKILFIRGGAVGDFILTLPAIRLVREQLPENHLTVLGYPAITELAKVTGLVDETRSLEDARLAHFFNPQGKLDPDWCDFFAGFDVVVSYLFDPDGFFAGNLERAGVKTLFAGPFKPTESKPSLPAAVQLAEPLQGLALFLNDPELTLDFPPSLAPIPLPPESAGAIASFRIGIHPGSGSPLKNWPHHAWIELLSEIRTLRPEAEFLITSGEAEYETIDRFLDLLRERELPFVHLTGKSLAEVGAVFSRLDYFLGHDSGISHLAGSCGIPGLLLFGPTNPDVWAPATSRFAILRSGTGEMSGLTVPEVLAKLQESDLFTRS